MDWEIAEKPCLASQTRGVEPRRLLTNPVGRSVASSREKRTHSPGAQDRERLLDGSVHQRKGFSTRPPEALRTVIYRNSIWLLPVVIVALSFWLVHRLPAKPVPIQLATNSLEATGPNLLENASFSRGLQDWFEYHNAQAMRISTRGSGGAEIRLGDARDSVQEIYQRFEVPPGGTLVATGRVRVAGSPLPPDASVAIDFTDTSGHTTTGFYVWPATGLGAVPFAFLYTPNGTARVFSLAVVVGKMPGSKSAVIFEDLNVARARLQQR